MASRGRRAAVRRLGALTGAAALTVLGAGAPSWAAGPQHPDSSRTATPVKHVVVLFDENISFDHYFATYPEAANTDGTKFTASPHTPRDIDNLRTAGLLKHNPNQYAPKRLAPQQAMTCDQTHDYGPEQYAYNGGKADKFVQNTDSGKCSGGLFGEPGLVMDYYDGNTVTGLWNYASTTPWATAPSVRSTAPPPRAPSTWSPDRPTASPPWTPNPAPKTPGRPPPPTRTPCSHPTHRASAR